MHRYLPIFLISILFPTYSGTVAAEEGRFYTVSKDANGSWWFLNPRGEQFLSLGVGDIPSGPTADEYDPANPSYASFRHYDNLSEWAKSVRKNLRGWGFNTIGAWGHPLLASDDFPECRVLHWGSTLQVPWCDLFADEFREQVEAYALRDVAPRKNDPQLLGWFLDNELQWYADTIFLFHLHQAEPTHTRRVLVDMLRDRYDGDFAALTVDFDPGDAKNFDELGQKGQVYLKPDGKGYSAVSQFAYLVAERYYCTFHDAIRRQDPHHLILGDRYMSYCPPAVAKAAGPYLDVISTNFDWPDWTAGEFPTHFLRMLHEQSGKPVLVTEWYVAAQENRSGNRNTGENFTKVPTQADRAVTAERRLDALMREPYIVGAHWFRYADEPTNGREGDGEDFNFGLVDIHDEPYEGLTEAMKRANKRASELHEKAAARNPTAPLAVRRLVDPIRFPGCEELFTPVAASGPSPLADLRLAWDDEHIYVGLVGFRFMERNLLKDETIPPSLNRWLTVEVGDATFEMAVQAGGVDQQAALAVVETRHRHRGVRFTYLVTIPTNSIPNISQLRQGGAFPFKAVLHDPGEESTMWKTTLVLAEDQ